MPHSSEYYAALFNLEGEPPEQALDRLHHREVAGYRMTTITSGPVKEFLVYPLWNTRNQVRNAKLHKSRKAQQDLNDRNAALRIVRLSNTNFTPADLVLTLTYPDGYLPMEEEARKHIKKYLRDIRAWRRGQGLPELKYIYVIEFGGAGGKEKRVHHHVIMSGMDRDEAERIWGRGRANSRRLQPDDYGLEGIARYIIKEKKPAAQEEGRTTSRKRWAASRNLEKPKVTKSDTRISKRRVERMAADFRQAPAEIFGGMFPEYRFNDCTVKTSTFVAGAYIYARMRRKPDGRSERRTRKDE